LISDLNGKLIFSFAFLQQKKLYIGMTFASFSSLLKLAQNVCVFNTPTEFGLKKNLLGLQQFL
jgi:hypothetical protein